MGLLVTVGGVPRGVLRKGGVTVTKPYNERWTADVTFEAGYVPSQREEIVIYYDDEVTPMFGGLVMEVNVREDGGFEGPLFASVTCVDWWVYLDWILVNGGYGGSTVSLKQVLTDLVNNYLTSYGISLAPGQATGPTGSSPGLNWSYKWASDVIRDLTNLSGGWVASITPGKVLEAVNPSLGSPSAPYALTDAAPHCLGLSWNRNSSEYANRVTIKCGGSKTVEVTQTHTLTAGDISNGYLDLYAPTIPTGGVAATVNAVPKTIGPAGSELIWTWDGGTNTAGQAVPRITSGTISPALQAGDVLAITFTAQMPFYYTTAAGPTPYLDVYYEYEEITEETAAADMAAGLLSKHYQEPRVFTIPTLDAGFEPGQVLTINLTKYQVNTAALITQVTVEVDGETGTWIYTLTALDGVYKGGPLDFFRSLGGRPAAGGGATFTSGVNTSVVLTTPVSLGGSTEQSRYPAAGTYEKVVNAPPFVAPATMSCVVRVELWARNSGVQVTARLRNLDTSTTVGTSSGVTSQTPVLTSFSAALVSGERYELQVTSDVSGESIYGIGTLQAT